MVDKSTPFLHPFLFVFFSLGRASWRSAMGSPSLSVPHDVESLSFLPALDTAPPFILCDTLTPYSDHTHAQTKRESSPTGLRKTCWPGASHRNSSLSPSLSSSGTMETSQCTTQTTPSTNILTPGSVLDLLSPKNVPLKEHEQQTSSSHSPAQVPSLSHAEPDNTILGACTRETPASSTSSQNGSSPHSRRVTTNHIKRPCNAFILFRSHAVTTNLIPKEIERDHRNISRIISHMWHNLSDSERKLWEQQADLEKQRHRQQHPNYKYRPSSRRSNVHRRNIRRLSSTERQCEHIADAILKSCGREGVKKHRPPRRATRRRASHRDISFNMSLLARPVPFTSCMPPDWMAPTSTITSAPTATSAGTTADSLVPQSDVPRLEPPSRALASARESPPAHSHHSELLRHIASRDRHPAEQRRSSSAPPCTNNVLQGSIPDIPGRQMTFDETMNWLFGQTMDTCNSPILQDASMSTPSALTSSPATMTPNCDACWPSCYFSSEESAGEHTKTLEQLENFALGTPLLALDSSTSAMLPANEMPIPPILLPPVSPKTQVPFNLQGVSNTACGGIGSRQALATHMALDSPDSALNKVSDGEWQLPLPQNWLSVEPCESQNWETSHLFQGGFL